MASRLSAITFPHSDDGLVHAEVQRNGWEMISLWRFRNGRPEPIEVAIHGAVDDDAAAMSADDIESLPVITAEAVRKLPLGEMLSLSLKEIRRTAGSVRDAKPDHPALAGVSDKVLAEAIRSGKPQRGQQLGDAELAAVAQVYREAWANGEPVNHAVREAFYLSKDGAAKRISKARAAGLLEGIGPKR